MIVRRVHIKDGVVVNISKGDTEKPWTAPNHVAVVELKNDEYVAIGYLYDGTTFTEPEPVTPTPQATVDDKIAALEKRIADLELKVK